MRYLTAGESHGKALAAIMDDIPAGIKIDLDVINGDLSRRQKGYGRGARMKIEQDKAEFLSGIRGGYTLGSPITVLVQNLDYKNWTAVMDCFDGDLQQRKVTEVRPGHADLSGSLKYNFLDARNILERASARSTAATVAIGGVAKCFLSCLGIEILSRTVSIGGEKDDGVYNFEDLKKTKNSPVSAINPEAEKRMVEAIDRAVKSGDTVGGEFEVRAHGLKAGLGSHTQADLRLDYALTGVVGGIMGVKSVEIGAGKDFAEKTGTEIHDEIYFENGAFVRKTNNAGGVEGGISNGSDLILRAVFKPIPTTMKGLQTIDLETKKGVVSSRERSDFCAVPAAAVVAEAVVALTLMSAVQKLVGGDYMEVIVDRWNRL